MFAFLQNLLPRLRQYSQSLDQTELFVDKPWVLIDEDGRQQTYIFRRGGELLMSLDGQVQMGKWDYIAPAQSLLVDRGVDKLLLNHFFFTDALLVLARDGKADSKFVLANRQLIPDLNVEKYLKNFEVRQTVSLKNSSGLLNGRELRQSQIKTITGDLLDFFAFGDSVANGDAIYIGGNPAPDGRYVTIDKWGICSKKGLVKNLFWPKQYRLKTGQQIVVDCQKTSIAPQCWDKVWWPSGVRLEDGKYNLDEVGKIRVRDGIIEGFPIF